MMKMVIVVRKDIGMSTGKMCAQVGHAAVDCAMITQEKDKIVPIFFKKYTNWKFSGQKKVAVKVNSLEELEEIEKKAIEAGLVTSKIVDFGLTQIEPNTVTVLGIGPDDEKKIDAITAHLKLL